MENENRVRIGEIVIASRSSRATVIRYAERLGIEAFRTSRGGGVSTQ